MKLGELLKDAGVIYMNADPEMEVDLPRYDSRMVSSGDVFVAIEGFERTATVLSPRLWKRARSAASPRPGPGKTFPMCLFPLQGALLP